MVVWRPSTYPYAAGNAFKSADGFGRLLKRVGVSLPAGVYGMYMTFIWGYVYVACYATSALPRAALTSLADAVPVCST